MERVRWADTAYAADAAASAVRDAYERAGFPETDVAGIVVQDLDGRIIAANHQAAEVLRQSWDQLVGRTSMDPSWAACSGDGGELPGERHPAMVAMRRDEPQRGFVMGVYAVDAADQEAFVWIEVDADPLHDHSGVVVGVVAHFVDVTRSPTGDLATARIIRRLRSSQAAARAAEQRFRLLAENSAEVVLQVAGDGTCAWVSPSVRDTLGYEQSALTGRPLSSLLHPDDTLPLDCEGRGESGRACPLRQGVVRLPDSRGEIRFMSCLVRCLTTADGSQEGCLISMRDVTHDLARREELEYLAAHDPLTGLVNREVALSAISAALHAAARSGRQVGLLFLDLDWFKQVNDLLGHEAGDRLLVDVARRLTAALRDKDVVARVGGDEFLVVLPSVADAAVVERRAEAVRAAIGRPPERGLAAATVSVGMAIGGGDVDPAQLVREGDQALYRAKAAGRDRLSW